MIKLLIALLLIAHVSNAQKLSLNDFTSLIDNRYDTLYLLNTLKSDGYTERGNYNDSTLVFYAKPTNMGKAITERVVLCYEKNVLVYIIYYSANNKNYQGMVNEILKTSRFLWLPDEDNKEQKTEGFTSARYIISGRYEKIKKRYSFLISARSADDPFPFED